MSSKKYAKQPSWQPDRSQKKTTDSSPPSQQKPLEVADIAPGAMMDNVERSMANQETPATPSPEFVQPKLTLGQPHDKYEREADRVAKEVVQSIRAPEPTASGEPSLQCKTEAFQQIWRPTLQAKGNKGGETNNEFERTLNQAKSSGQPLDTNLQRSMGKAMGADFSGVKVHTDSTANDLSQSIQAKAFTTGKDVFFKKGAYNPGSQGGQELIAHELTHVVQQNPSSMVEGQVQRQQLETEGTGPSGNTIQRTFEQARDRAKEVFEGVSDETTEQELKALIVQAEAKDNDAIANEIRMLWAVPSVEEATEFDEASDFIDAEDESDLINVEMEDTRDLFYENGKPKFAEDGTPLYQNGNPKVNANGEPLYDNGNPKFDEEGHPLTNKGKLMPYQPTSAVSEMGLEEAFAPERGKKRNTQVDYLTESARQASSHLMRLITRIVKLANQALPANDQCYHLPFTHILKTKKSARDKARRTAKQWEEGVQLALMDVLRATIVCKTDTSMAQVRAIADKECAKILKSFEGSEDGKHFEMGHYDRTKTDVKFYQGYADVKYNIPIEFLSGTQAVKSKAGKRRRDGVRKPARRTRNRARILQKATIRAELQILIEAMADAKEKSIGHSIYDMTRAAERNEDWSYRDTTLSPSMAGVQHGALTILIDPIGRDLLEHNFENPGTTKAKLQALAGVTPEQVTTLQGLVTDMKANPDNEAFAEQYKAITTNLTGESQDFTVAEFNELEEISKVLYTQKYWMKLIPTQKAKLHKTLLAKRPPTPPAAEG